MANNTTSIQESRKAAEDLISAGNALEDNRKKKKAAAKVDPVFDSGLTDSEVESRPPILNDDYPDAGIAHSIDVYNRRQNRKATNEFFRAARRKRDVEENPNKRNPSQIAFEISEMSDEDFDKAVSSGKLTPEMIRKAAEYEHDVWMGDVWGETDAAETEPEPTAQEFYANLEKYGYDTKEDYHKFSRYVPYMK